MYLYFTCVELILVRNIAFTNHIGINTYKYFLLILEVLYLWQLIAVTSSVAQASSTSWSCERTTSCPAAP